MNKITKWLLLAVFLGRSLVFAGPLHDAAAAGNLTEVKKILDKGRNIEAIDKKYGWTALMRASFNGHPEVVKELLNRGADIEAKDMKEGWTSLMKANVRRHSEVVKAIREWSIENQVRITDPRDIKILDGNDPDSYNRDFAAYGTKEQRKAIIEGTTGIPKGPASIIHQYLGGK